MQSRLSTFLDLSLCTPLRRGQLRDVYAHPELENVLVKVIRADRVTATGETRPWKQKYLNIRRDRRLQIPFTYAGKRKWGLYASFYRELREQLRAARAVYPQVDFQFPFAPVLGLVWTTQGLGLMAQKMVGPDGALAPTLRELIRAGSFTPEHLAKLDAFFDLAAARHVVFGDLNASNLVLAAGREGSRIVCVDGIGEKALIPVHEWSAWANGRKLRRLRDRMMGSITRRLPADAERAGAA